MNQPTFDFFGSVVLPCDDDAQLESDPREIAIYEKMLRYVSAGRPVVFTLEMTVCELHQLWDVLSERGHEASCRLRRFSTRLSERCKSLPKAEKKRVREVIQRAERLAVDFSYIAEILYSTAQQEFSAAHLEDADEHFSDAFWMDVGFRPGIEQTWELTISAVLTALKQMETV